MSQPFILAIDPGASGGLAYWGQFGVIALPMGKTEGDVLEQIRMTPSAIPDFAMRVAVVEAVSGYAGQGQPGSAMFKFGRGFGFILGVLAARGWRIELVRPQVWLKKLGLGTCGAMSKTQWKNKLKARAQQLYPGVKVTLKTADALLLLEYANLTRTPTNPS